MAVVDEATKSEAIDKSWLKGRRLLVVVILILGVLGGGVWLASAAKVTNSLWSKNRVPHVISSTSNASVELGVRFKSKYAGQVTGIKFYKGPQNTGAHTGSLWDSKGALLAKVAFTNETSSGWQTATLSQPVSIAANVPYTVSYHAPKGHYSYDTSYFKGGSSTGGPLTAEESTAKNPNGVYATGSNPAFPQTGLDATNFWVDVLFTTKALNPTPKPAPPVSATASQKGSAVVVSWPAANSANPISSYKIIRDGEQIASVNAQTLSYSDTSVKGGQSHSYQIVTQDNQNVLSDTSPTSSVTYNVTPAACPAGQVGMPPNCAAPASPTPIQAPTPTPEPAPIPTPTRNPTPSPTSYWVPTQGMTWQWQLTTPVDTSFDAQVYDIDRDNDASVVGALHAEGKKVICYIETGFWESYRSDSSSYPESVLGKSLAPPFSDERYVDVSQTDVVLPIIQKRLDTCKQKGFDAVEPDGDAMMYDAGGSTANGVDIGTGHTITYQNLINYNKMIAQEAHKRGMSIGLKNGSSGDNDQFVKDMQPFTDWDLEEECGVNNSCESLKPFVDNNKAVFAAEYSDNSTLEKCNSAAQANPTFRFIFKDRGLSAQRQVCQ